MKYCTKCGAGLREEARFCPKCGSSVELPGSSSGAFTPVKEDGGSKKKVAVVISIVFIVAAVLVGGILFFLHLSGEKEDKSIDTEKVRKLYLDYLEHAYPANFDYKKEKKYVEPDIYTLSIDYLKRTYTDESLNELWKVSGYSGTYSDKKMCEYMHRDFLEYNFEDYYIEVLDDFKEEIKKSDIQVNQLTSDEILIVKRLVCEEINDDIYEGYDIDDWEDIRKVTVSGKKISELYPVQYVIFVDGKWKVLCPELIDTELYNYYNKHGFGAPE